MLFLKILQYSQENTCVAVSTKECNNSKKVLQTYILTKVPAWNNIFQQSFDKDTPTENVRTFLSVCPFNFHALYWIFNKKLDEESKFF